ncbi:unnamed protein product [Paramecium primaurelia]|uniref:Uncharacterized protein n=1 Tax=Paramecium primaurelia TaxID=5886 RepID=A0A8S1MZZ7_PARPR|nr:unnamed protein product [Paramecium primaurelia]
MGQFQSQEKHFQRPSYFKYNARKNPQLQLRHQNPTTPGID